MSQRPSSYYAIGWVVIMFTLAGLILLIRGEPVAAIAVLTVATGLIMWSDR